MTDSAEPMTSQDYRELERLAQKAAWDERVNHQSENNYNHLINTAIFASRRA